MRRTRSSRNRATRTSGIGTSAIGPGRDLLRSSTMLSTRTPRQSARCSLTMSNEHLCMGGLSGTCGASWSAPECRARCRAGTCVCDAPRVFSAQHRVQAQVAVPQVLRRIILWLEPILLHRPRKTSDPARAPLAEPTPDHQKAHGSSRCHGPNSVSAAGPSSRTCPASGPHSPLRSNQWRSIGDHRQPPSRRTSCASYRTLPNRCGDADRCRRSSVVGRRARLALLQHTDDLFFCETSSLHGAFSFVHSKAENSSSQWPE